MNSLASYQFPSAIEFARAIDAAAEGGATEKWVPPKWKPLPTGPTTAGESVSSLDAIIAALEKAATAQDQLELSCGLPLVFNSITQRYSLAPTAAAVLKYNIESAHRPVIKLNLNASALFASRLANAKANKV